MIGTVISGRYEILAEIGEGGMAAVYQARDLRLQREVAIKILHPHIAKQVEFCQRFYQEAAIAAKLVHPNIVQIHDYGTSEDGRTFIVSELIRGRDFHVLQVEKLKTTGKPFSPVFCAMVCEEVLKALGAAHKQKVVHRDVKPDNVMISTDGTVKLTDFGIAKNIGASMTVAGHFLGSPVYSSPEQVQGGDIDLRSDIYSAGIILYEAVTGHLPFNGQNAQEVMMRIVRGNYVRAKNLLSSVPQEFDNIIHGALRANRDDRYASAEKMAEKLRDFLASCGVENSHTGLENYFKSPEKFLKDHPIQGAVVEVVLRQPEKSAEKVALAVTLPSEQREKRQSVSKPPRKGSDEKMVVHREQRPNRRTGVISKPRRDTLGQAEPESKVRQVAFPILAFAAFISAAIALFFVVPWNQIVSLNRIPPTPPPTGQVELPNLNTRIPGELLPARATPKATPEVLRPTATPAGTPSGGRYANNPKPPRKTPTNDPPRVAIVTTTRQPMPVFTATPVRTITKPAFGKVTVQTIPSGVSVSIDGKNVGTTGDDGEGRVFELKPGMHVLAISPSEFSGVKYGGLERKIFIEGGKTVSLGLLRLVPYRQLTVAIAGPGVIVRVNGDPYPLNGKPLTLSLPEGRVEIRARAANGKTFDRNINLKGENFTLNVSLE